MKKFISSKIVSLALVFATALMMAGCGVSDGGTSNNDASDSGSSVQDTAQTSGSSGEKIVNIGITDSLGGINPLTIEQTWVNKYAVGLEFLPLVELDGELNFQPMLADSVTTEDNRNFIVHIDDNAMWSDGTPVTAEDVEFTFAACESCDRQSDVNALCI